MAGSGNIFVGFSSALDYWRAQSACVAQGSSPRVDRVPLTRAIPKPGVTLSSERFAEFDHSQWGMVAPIEVVVADFEARRRVAGTIQRVWHAPGSGAFYKIAKGVYVSSPEALFAQMATRLSQVDLVLLGYELCGAYSLARQTERGFVDRAPLATVDSLSRFIDRIPSEYGMKKARRALRFVANGSASPMETNVAMLLCLPTVVGGFGFELPQMNYRIEIASPAARTIKTKSLRLDLCGRASVSRRIRFGCISFGWGRCGHRRDAPKLRFIHGLDRRHGNAPADLRCAKAQRDVRVPCVGVARPSAANPGKGLDGQALRASQETALLLLITARHKGTSWGICSK